MEASTSNQPRQEQPFAYPSGVKAADYVTLELSPKSYFVWKQLMLMFLESQELSGFVDGTISKIDKPPALDMYSNLIDERWKEKKEMEEERKRIWNKKQSERAEEGIWDEVLQNECEIRRRVGRRLWKEADQENRQKHLAEWLVWKRKWDKKWLEKLKEFDYEEWKLRMEWIEKEENRAEEKQKREEAEQMYMGWKRSDGLVKRWTLALVTQEMLQQVIHLETARDVWIKLEEILSPSLQLSHHDLIDMTEKGRGEILKQYVKLHKAALNGNWEAANEFFEHNPSAYLQPITCCLETALIVAVRSDKRNDFVGNLITKMVQYSNQRKNREQEMKMRMEKEMMDGMDEMGLEPMGKSLRVKMERMERDMMQDIVGLEGKRMEEMMLERMQKMELQLTEGMEKMDPEGMRKTLRERMEKWLQERMDESVPLLAQKDKSGATALHAAVEGGNKYAAEMLLAENQELANSEEKDGKLPVHVAADLGNRAMVGLLLPKTAILQLGDESDPAELKNKRAKLGHKLLRALASSGLYDTALEFLKANPKLASMEPSPLIVMAQKRTSFVSGTNWNWLQRRICSERKNLNAMFWDAAEKLESVLLSPYNCRQDDPNKKIRGPIKYIRETNKIHYQALDLVKCLCDEAVNDTGFLNAAKIFREPLMTATRAGINEIVEKILEAFPSAIHLKSEKNQSLFHLAIEYRREKVFNLIYQMEEDRRGLLSTADASTNNALHLAGNLGQQQQLLLRASAAGAALQMQSELQWFKEVGNFILPHAKESVNADRKTPQEVFTDTHKDLVKEGEKWMKGTATSCTITAALIMTILFAAAITVPGGSKIKTGIPIQLGTIAFTFFGIFDALALLASSTSLLIFLSILTCRYGEHDFLYSLPTRMIFGLMTLFLSIIAMMVAFAATIIILFGEEKKQIHIIVALSCCLPVVVFGVSQFLLLYTMIKSTYRPGIFGKQSKRTLH